MLPWTYPTRPRCAAQSISARAVISLHMFTLAPGCSIDSRVPVECEHVDGVCVEPRADAAIAADASSLGGSADAGHVASAESMVATGTDASGAAVPNASSGDEQTSDESTQSENEPASDAAATQLLGETQSVGETSEPGTSDEQPDGAMPAPAMDGGFLGPPNDCEPDPECAPRYRELVAGNSFTCGLTTEGAVRCWGLSPDHPSNTFPAVIAEGAYRDLAAADSFLCGIDEAARLSCWGLPNSTTAFSPDGSFTQVAAGEGAICAVGMNTELACWTPNGATLGLAVVDGFTRVAVGPYHICGLQTDASLLCWETAGGDVLPTPDGNFDSVAVGASQVCAIDDDKKLSCWDNDGVASLDVPAGEFEQVALSSYAASDRACAVKTDGTAECWGAGGGGVPIADVGPYVGLTVGAAHVCLLRGDETAKCGMTNYEDERWGQTTPPAYTPECGAYSDVQLGDSYLLRDLSAAPLRACVQTPWDGATRLGLQAEPRLVDAPGYDDYPEPAPAGAFPSVVWGLHEGRFFGTYQEPVVLSELGLLQANFTWRVPESSAAAFAVVYEITIGPTRDSGEGALPILLWLHSRNVSQPMLEPQYAEYVSDSPWTITRSAPNASRASLVYYSTNDDFGNCAFCDGFSQLSLSAFVHDAVARELAEDTWYLLGVRAGFKVWQASASDVFRFDVFDLKLQ